MKGDQFQAMVRRVGDILLEHSPSPESLTEAEQIVEHLLTQDRENPGLTFLMGSIFMKQGRWAVAEHWMRHSLNMHPDRAEPWNNLGYIYQQESRMDEASKAFDKALTFADDNQRGEILSNKASMLVNSGTPNEALAACEAALEVDPNCADAKWNRGLALLEMGNWQEGWKAYEQGLNMGPSSTAQRKKRTYPDGDLPLWEGTADKSVVVYGEQGVGDEIMGASMLPDLIENNEVMLEAHPRLVTLFRRAWGDQIPIYGTRKTDINQLAWRKWAKPEAKAPILHLGRFFRSNADQFPRQAYLLPLDEQREDANAWLRSLGERPRIGIAWQGGTMGTRADVRSIPLPYWLPILQSIDATWVSLQYDPAEAPGMWAPIVERFCEKKGAVIHHDTEKVNDLDMCYGGIIHELDLVVAVNTSLVHACGAMGVECWSPTPRRVAWRYGVEGEHMPWYGDWVRLIRQPADDWQPVLEQIQAELAERFGVRAAA